MRGHRATVILWTTFAYLLAGVSLINPLLPTIRVGLGVSTGGLATLYSVYLIALVPLLLLIPRVKWRATGRTRLLLAVGLMAASDVLHAAGHPSALGVGRLLLASSVALGTASVAELAVLTAGQRGRTVTATANTAGALIGTLLGALGLLLAASPVRVVFLGHALAALALPVVILRGVPDLTPSHIECDLSGRFWRAGGRSDGFVLGGFAFAAGATVLVLGTNLIEQDHPPLGHRAQFVPIAMFIAAALTQSLARNFWRSIHAWGLVTLAGLGLMLWAVVVGSVFLLVSSAAVTGAGFGALFMLGLAWTTHNVADSAQGSLASAYACSAYSTAAAVTIGGGFLSDAAGAPAALLVILLGSSAAFVAWAIRTRSHVVSVVS